MMLFFFKIRFQLWVQLLIGQFILNVTFFIRLGHLRRVSKIKFTNFGNTIRTGPGMIYLSLEVSNYAVGHIPQSWQITVA